MVTREILALLSQVRILIGQHFCCFMTHSRIINKDLIVAIYKRDIKTLQQYWEKEHKDIVVMELCDYYGFGECLNKDYCEDCKTYHKLTAFELVYALCNIFKYYKQNEDYHIYKSMIDLFSQNITPILPRINYGNYHFITYNAFDDNYYDEESEENYRKYGARDIDIQLTNLGIRHKQEEVVNLLKQGASPYMENDLDVQEGHGFHYYDVSPLLEVLTSNIQFVSMCTVHTVIDNDFKEDDTTEHCFIDTFRDIIVASAHIEILFLVDKYILPQVRKKGKEMMQRKLGEVYEIV